jgi:hypothetical protein
LSRLPQPAHFFGSYVGVAMIIKGIEMPVQRKYDLGNPESSACSESGFSGQFFELGLVIVVLLLYNF